MPRFRSSRRFGRRTSGPRRNREWISFTTGLSYYEPRTEILTAGQTFAAWVLDPGQALSLFDEPTLVRSLLVPSIYINATTAQAAAEYRMTLRGGFITWKGSTAGEITGELDGIDPSDGSLDWLWWVESHFNHYGTQAYLTRDHDFSGNSGVVDVRSKRKLENGYGLVGAWICEGDSTPTSSVGINFHFSGRLLFLNH